MKEISIEYSNNMIVSGIADWDVTNSSKYNKRERYYSYLYSGEKVAVATESRDEVLERVFGGIYATENGQLWIIRGIEGGFEPIRVIPLSVMQRASFPLPVIIRMKGEHRLPEGLREVWEGDVVVDTLKTDSKDKNRMELVYHQGTWGVLDANEQYLFKFVHHHYQPRAFIDRYAALTEITVSGSELSKTFTDLFWKYKTDGYQKREPAPKLPAKEDRLFDKLQSVIQEIGIENVRLRVNGEAHWTPNKDAICKLSKYWENDDFNSYVHKIYVIDMSPAITSGVFGIETRIAKHAYYMSDLESSIRRGTFVIMGGGS
jgi:hypothetical protein